VRAGVSFVPMSIVSPAAVAASALVLALAASPDRLVAQTPTIEEQLVVREIGVLADLPSDLRGATRDELGRRLRVTEDGIEREVVSVGAVGGAGSDAYSRIVILFDVARCSQEILLHGASAFGAHSDDLVALGPVELARLGVDGIEPVFGPSRSAADASEALAVVSTKERCEPAADPERLARLAERAETLVCDAPPCLLAWIGPGWGATPEEGAPPRPVAPEAMEPLARQLASSGWAFLAAPIAREREAARRPNVREPATLPGSDRHTFGINLLSRRRGDTPMAEEEYARYLDLWLAPLRRLVDATAGEYVDVAEDLPGALAAFAKRSLVYYRAERRADGERPRLEIRRPGEAGPIYRAPEWAPAIGR